MPWHEWVLIGVLVVVVVYRGLQALISAIARGDD